MSYSYETQFNSPNYTAARDALKVFGFSREIDGFTLHWWGDPNTNPQYVNIVNYLCRTNGNTSAHIVTSGTNRKAACIVDYSNVAWHSGSAWGNARTIGIELDPRAREEDKDVFAEVLADLRSAFGNKPLYWHSYFTATACPGVYKDLLDDLDQRSYQKISGAEFGQVTNKTAPVVVPPVVTPPAQELYKVLDQTGAQVGAFAEEGNAYKKYVDGGRVGKILFKGKNIAPELDTKYTTPSPTATPPEQGGGQPITDKPDYAELLEEIKKNRSLIQWIVDFLKSIFKGA